MITIEQITLSWDLNSAEDTQQRLDSLVLEQGQCVHCPGDRIELSG